MAQLQPNPLAFFQGLAQAASQHPIIKQASAALQGLQNKTEDAPRWGAVVHWVRSGVSATNVPQIFTDL